VIKTTIIQPHKLWPNPVVAEPEAAPVKKKPKRIRGKTNYHMTPHAKALRLERMRIARTTKVMQDPTSVMTRVCLADIVALRARVTHEQANEVLRAAFEVIFEKLAVGGRVNCTPLGTFETRTHKLVSYHDVRTGKHIARNGSYRLATFRGSLALKNTLKGYVK
jgi:nucleoid DNA-binding protein